MKPAGFTATRILRVLRTPRFKGNELEIMSLQAAGGDEGWKQRIRQFWHGYLHALMSVEGGHSFYAVDTSNGAAACACAPEFEEIESAAPSLLEFLELVTTGRVKI